jgi:uncharacterized SAM-binding protein YcdF (DUF218 family)
MVRSLKQPLRQAALILIVLAAFVFGGSMASVATYAANHDPASADVAIVLGAAVWNRRPTPVFAERINHALTLYRSGTVKALIFTGGLGSRDSLTESQAAREYALARGVPERDIYIETTSRTTLDNLREAQQIMARQNLRRALVVSDPLHMKRAMAMARDLGLNAGPAPTPTTRYRTWFSQVPFLMREGYFYLIYLVRDRPYS